MSTPRREDVERLAREQRAERRVAEAARAFQREVDDAYGSLGPWDQGYVHSAARLVVEVRERYDGSADLHARVLEAQRTERTAAIHLRAIACVERETSAAFYGDHAPLVYSGLVPARAALPEAGADNVRTETRVYAVGAEEPLCVAVEGDGEWVFVEELP